MTAKNSYSTECSFSESTQSRIKSVKFSFGSSFSVSRKCRVSTLNVKCFHSLEYFSCGRIRAFSDFSKGTGVLRVNAGLVESLIFGFQQRRLNFSSRVISGIAIACNFGDAGLHWARMLRNKIANTQRSSRGSYWKSHDRFLLDRLKKISSDGVLSVALYLRRTSR